MPDTIIRIYDYKIEIEENKKIKRLCYKKEEIKEIIEMFLRLSHNWHNKYIEKSIIDEDIYTIEIIDNNIKKEYYIKNKHPNNWSDFILFRNKLIREEIKFREE